MFDKIMLNQKLGAIVCHDCSENNTAVDFDSTLLMNGFLDDKKVLILKPDSYYNTRDFATPPPSPDCLILINYATEARYDLYLIELKDVKDTTQLKYDIIVEKFKTMIEQFFPKFSSVFYLPKYKSIQFYLVTTYPKNSGQLSQADYYSRIAGSALDAYGSRKPLKLFNKAVLIQPVPSPFKITAC